MKQEDDTIRLMPSTDLRKGITVATDSVTMLWTRTVTRGTFVEVVSWAFLSFSFYFNCLFFCWFDIIKRQGHHHQGTGVRVYHRAGRVRRGKLFIHSAYRKSTWLPDCRKLSQLFLISISHVSNNKCNQSKVKFSRMSHDHDWLLCTVSCTLQ